MIILCNDNDFPELRQKCFFSHDVFKTICVSQTLARLRVDVYPLLHSDSGAPTLTVNAMGVYNIKFVPMTVPPQSNKKGLPFASMSILCYNEQSDNGGPTLTVNAISMYCVKLLSNDAPSQVQ